MSLDSVVFALKSFFKTKHRKSFFFTLLTQVYVGFVQLYVTEITVITCSVKGTAVFSPCGRNVARKVIASRRFSTLGL